MLARRMSLRSSSPAARCLAVVSGCRCTDGAVDLLPDGSGMVVTGCTTDEACGLGESCLGGPCQPAQVDDAGTVCTTGECRAGPNMCLDAGVCGEPWCEPVNYRFNTGEVTGIRACVFSPVPARVEQMN